MDIKARTLLSAIVGFVALLLIGVVPAQAACSAGYPILADATGTFTVCGTTQPLVTLPATTATISATLLSLGCTTATVNVLGATNGMAVDVSPVSSPGGGVQWQGYVSSNGVVTVQVCALAALSLTAVSYNVRVIQ